MIASKPASPDIAALAKDLRAGHRAALARAITLVESTRPDHRAEAVALLAALPPAFAERGLSTEPYARSIDPTGAAVLPLIEADPIRQGTTPARLLTDEQWLALQQICAG